VDVKGVKIFIQQLIVQGQESDPKDMKPVVCPLRNGELSLVRSEISQSVKTTLECYYGPAVIESCGLGLEILYKLESWLCQLPGSELYPKAVSFENQKIKHRYSYVEIPKTASIPLYACPKEWQGHEFLTQEMYLQIRIPECYYKKTVTRTECTEIKGKIRESFNGETPFWCVWENELSGLRRFADFLVAREQIKIKGSEKRAPEISDEEVMKSMKAIPLENGNLQKRE
jgi:hypothetical protein